MRRKYDRRPAFVVRTNIARETSKEIAVEMDFYLEDRGILRVVGKCPWQRGILRMSVRSPRSSVRDFLLLPECDKFGVGRPKEPSARKKIISL